MTHVDFIRAVSSEFMAIFEKDPMPAAGQIPEIKAVDETVLKQKDERAEYIRKGMDELTVSRMFLLSRLVCRLSHVSH